MTTKAQAVVLMGFGERAADETGATIDTRRISGPIMVLSRISSISGAGAAAVISIEDSADGNTWALVGSFASRNAPTAPPDILAFDRVARYVRAKVDVSGTTPKIRNEVIGILT